VAELHVTRWGSGPPVVFVHGSFGWGEETWAAQRPLADDFELLLVDRRGFGRSPSQGRVDFERDADDVSGLLPRPAHLVGHSYGGVVALLAAARNPTAVRSLAVIEPPALGLVRGDRVVEEYIEELEELAARTTDPSVYRMGFVRTFGFPSRPAELDGLALEAARASMTERMPWEAEIPLGVLAGSPFPKLVVRGDWRNAPVTAQQRAGAIFHAVCDVLEAHLDAERAAFPATHNPQLLGRPFNDRLRAFWSGAQAACRRRWRSA
jgi:pimeloyl-ACP methyl ester carboxylesterase